jgi:anaerobic ribonucleoside-triphosphate reductase activating protein
MKDELRIHHLIERTRANGPGMRAALWVQGCSLSCPGCFNPETHPSRGGQVVPVGELFRRISSIPDIEGVSILGGEPLQQRRQVFALLRLLRARTSLSVLLFTGFTEAEIARMPGARELPGLVDVLFAGRYDQSQRLARDLRGSRNKTVSFFTTLYSEQHLREVPQCELVIDEQGFVTINGMDPLVW